MSTALISAFLRFTPTAGGPVESPGTMSLSRSVSGDAFIYRKQTIDDSADALDLGSVSTPGLCWMRNNSTQYYVELRSGAGGADLLKLKPGDVQAFRFTSDAVPYAICENATGAEIEYLILPN